MALLQLAIGHATGGRFCASSGPTRHSTAKAVLQRKQHFTRRAFNTICSSVEWKTTEAHKHNWTTAAPLCRGVCNCFHHQKFPAFCYQKLFSLQITNFHCQAIDARRNMFYSLFNSSCRPCVLLKAFRGQFWTWDAAEARAGYCDVPQITLLFCCPLQLLRMHTLSCSYRFLKQLLACELSYPEHCVFSARDSILEPHQSSQDYTAGV